MEVQLVDENGNVIDSGWMADTSEEVDVTPQEHSISFTLQDNRPDDIKAFRERVKNLMVDEHSEEGQEIINDGRTHVTLVYEDGEIVTTKAGDLFGYRSLHQSDPPTFPENSNVVLTPDGEEDGAITDNHTRMVVKKPDTLRTILKEFR